MKSVFVSSVIRGFETFRQAAKEAVELLGHSPVMSEEFGARPYSAETTCLAEVEQAEVYLLVLGKEYGFLTEEGISVTESEFRVARELRKPILAFVQNGEMETRQANFKAEVEHYHGGLFRASFASEGELKDAIIRGLKRLEVKDSAIGESEFESRVSRATESLRRHCSDWNEPPEMVVAFLPQPERSVDIVQLESQLDNLFFALSESGMTSLRDGYQPLVDRDFTGLKTKRLCLATFDDGMLVLIMHPAVDGEGLFSGHFVPPVGLTDALTGFHRLIKAHSGYVRVALRNMGGAYVANPPGGNALFMKLFGEEEAGFTELFVPLSDAGYRAWIDQSIRRFSRIFSYSGGNGR